MKEHFPARYLMVINAAIFLSNIHIAVANQETREYNGSYNTSQNVVSMAGFPETCCHPFVGVVKHTGNLRLTFTDLDLPPYSTLLFLDNTGRLYPNQVQKPDGTFCRKAFHFTGPELRIVFTPPNDDDSESGLFAGFRLIVRATEADETDFNAWPLSERCPQLHSTDKGGQLSIRDNPALFDESLPYLPSTPFYDCIWVVKVPSQYTALADYHQGMAPEVFVWLSNFKIPDFLREETTLEIRHGLASTGDLLLKIDGKSPPPELRPGEALFTSANALYIRLQMPYTARVATERRGRGTTVVPQNDQQTAFSVGITYGIFKNDYNSGQHCDFAGSPGGRCSSEHWCLPWSYICDGVDHCPSKQDEIGFVCPEVKAQRAIKANNQKSPLSTASPPGHNNGDIPVYRFTENIEDTFSPRARMAGPGGNRDHFIECTFGRECWNEATSTYECVQYLTPCPGTSCNFVYCSTGQCVFTYRYCTEDSAKPCGYMEKKCPGGGCVSSTERCSCSKYGHRSCGENCIEAEVCPDENCPNGEFKCSNLKCIPSRWQCDGMDDCDDDSDEIGCQPTPGSEVSTTNTSSVFLMSVLLCFGIFTTVVCVGLCIGYQANKNCSSITSGTALGIVLQLLITLAFLICLCVVGCVGCRALLKSQRRNVARSLTPTNHLPAAATNTYVPVPTQDVPNPVSQPTAPYPTAPYPTAPYPTMPQQMAPVGPGVPGARSQDPPVYHEALNADRYRQPTAPADPGANQNDLAPPPSYEAAILGEQCYSNPPTLTRDTSSSQNTVL